MFDTVTRVKFLDEADDISFTDNTLAETMNTTIIPPAMCR